MAVVVLAVILVYAYRVVIDNAAHARYMLDRKVFTSFFQNVNGFRSWKIVTGLLVFLMTVWVSAWVQALLGEKYPHACWGRGGGANLANRQIVFSRSIACYL